MKKITAVTLATSLTASPTVGAIDAMAQSVEENNQEKNNNEQIDKPNTVDTLEELIGVVTTETLNIRQTPDTSKSSIGTLNKGDEVSIISQEDNGWYKINYNGDIGYVSEKYVKVGRSVSPDYSIKSMNKKGKVINVKSNDKLNVRSAPNTKGKILYKLPNDTKIKLTGKVSNGWYRVEYDSKEGFASGDFIKELEDTNKEVSGKVVNVSSDDRLNVREKATTKAKILYKLKNGTKVKILEELSNGWVKISYDGKKGYANGKYIEEIKTTEKPSADEKPSTDKNPSQGNNYRVTADINLRKDDSWSADIIRVAKKGEVLSVVSISGEWAKVNLDGKYAYAPAKYLEKTTEKPTKPQKPATKPYIVTEDINLRVSASWSADIVYVIKKGETLDVIEKGEEWDKVYYNDRVLYAPSKYLVKEGQQIEPEKPVKPQTKEYTVTADINMRKEKSWSADIIKVIKVGEVVDVVEYGDEWTQIYEDEQYGYVPSKYLIDGEITELPPQSSEVVGDTKFTDYNVTMSRYIQQQQEANPSYSTSKYKEYINPANGHKYEFLELNKFREINVNTLNRLLKENNAGVLMNQGQAIYNAAKKHNIDPLYFVAQSIHETGYGKSTLAQGVKIYEIANEDKPIKDSKGNITGYEMIPLDEPVTVYNLYGIGAKDNLPTMPDRALVLGTTYAYKKGWTSVEKAIEGAGEFVSNGYINNSKYNQNTLYKIRYNPNQEYLWHQYATSPWYARDIAKLMEKFDDAYENDVVFTYDKPRFDDSRVINKEVEITENENDFLARIGRDDIVLSKSWME